MEPVGLELCSRLTNAICQIVLAEDVLSGLRAPEVAVTEVPQRASNKFAGVAICKLPLSLPLSLCVMSLMCLLEWERWTRAAKNYTVRPLS